MTSAKQSGLEDAFMHRRLGWVVGWLVCLAVGMTLAQEAPREPDGPAVKPLALGDAAPAWLASAWLNGEAPSADGTRARPVRVLVFLMTGFSPSLETVPVLTQLQRKHAETGLEVLGFSAEDAAKLRAFVAAQGDKLGFRVAHDEESRTRRAYMLAFGERSIPQAFVVDSKNRIVWHGHPLDGLDETVAQVLAGTYDLDTAKKVEQAVKQVPAYFDAAYAGDREKAAKLGERLIEGLAKNPKQLARFAYGILIDPKLKSRDLDLASKAAQQAYDATGGKMLAAQISQARALFALGRFADAVEVQTAAASNAPEGRVREQMEQILADYRKAATQPEAGK